MRNSEADVRRWMRNLMFRVGTGNFRSRFSDAQCGLVGVRCSDSDFASAQLAEA
jgi:hypothetical protein